MLFKRWFVAAALLALVPPWVVAQGAASAPAASPPDPLNADAAVPAVAVPAVAVPRTFDSYHAYRDTGPAPWRETNAAVGPTPGGAAHGGHAGHSMPASAPAASSNKPAGESMPGMHHH